MELSQILLSLLLLLAITWYLKHYNMFPNIWPVLTILPFLLNGNHLNKMITRLSNSIGITVTIKDPLFTSTDYVGTCNPHNIEYIPKTNFSNFPKGPDFIEIVDIFGNALFSTDSHLEQWLVRKKALHRGLSSKEFRSFANRESRWEVEYVLLPLLVHLAKERIVVDLQDVFLRLTYDNSFTMVFGVNPKLLHPSFPVNEFGEAVDVVMETILYRHSVPSSLWKLLRKLKLGWEGTNFNARRTIDRIIQEMISLKKEKMDANITVGADDLLSICMLSREGEDENVDSLRDFAFGCLTAIGGTTASGMTWFFWLVSQTPTVEAKILEELTDVIGDKNNISKMRFFDQEEVQNLVYLHAAMCEALRLYPPVPLIPRAALEE